MILISDTGPLIALAKIGKIEFLKNLAWKAVFIPPMVQRELWGKIGSESAEIESGLNVFIQVTSFQKSDTRLETATADLDEGEKQVIISGALVNEEVFLLLDDQRGRDVAKHLEIPIIGTVGILLLAKRRGLIQQVLPLLHELREKGYWLSDALVRHVRRMAKED